VLGRLDAEKHAVKTYRAAQVGDVQADVEADGGCGRHGAHPMIPPEQAASVPGSKNRNCSAAGPCRSSWHTGAGTATRSPRRNTWPPSADACANGPLYRTCRVSSDAVAGFQAASLTSRRPTPSCTNQGCSGYFTNCTPTNPAARSAAIGSARSATRDTIAA